MAEDRSWVDEPEPGEPAKKKLPRWAKVLIVIGILGALGIVPCGLLATLMVPSLVHKLNLAKTAKAKADIMALSAAVETYAIENGGSYPASLEALVTRNDQGLTYLNRATVPVDPWGNPYGYEPPRQGSPKGRVFTLGADGEPGGEGDDRDIDNLLIEEGKI